MKVGDRALRVRRLLPQHTKAAGFTIIETMIVLAVTGALFVAIAATLSGRQNAAEFTHAIQSAQAQIQQVIDQVQQGYYPNNANFSCSSGGGGVQISSSGNNQGTNQDCVFLGKVIQFGVAGTDPEEYRVYTIAGLRAATAGTASPFVNASPTVVRVGANYTSYSETGHLQYGLTTLWVHANGNSMGAVGFLSEPGSLSATSTTGYNSGRQQVDLVPIRTTNIGQNYAQAVGGIENSTSNVGGLRDPVLTNSAPINPQSGVQVCFVSSTTNQSGLITIGGNGRQLLVKLDIKTNRTCS